MQDLPQRIYGTYPLKDKELQEAVALALDCGYRAFDTAQGYGNEAALGEALGQSGLSRSDLYVITKVKVDNFTQSAFLPSVEQSLTALRLTQVDALLLHWPTPGGAIEEALDLLQEAQSAGFAKTIGISNFTSAQMRAAKARVSVPLVTNQVEFHPLLDQSKLLAAAVETGIPLSAYCSVARGEVFKFPLFAELGEAYGRSAAQIVLRWILQKGVAVTCMSTKRANIKANFDILDFRLSDADMARIDAMGAINHRIVNRSRIPYAPDFD